MSAFHRIVDRVSRPRTIRPGQIEAACPCCQSKHGRPLKIRETDSGSVLIKPFCGCATADVLSALGLRWGDLYDKPLTHHIPRAPGGLSDRELLEVAAHEATVVAILACDSRERSLTEDELDRLTKAGVRLGKVQEIVRGRR